MIQPNTFIDKISSLPNIHLFPAFFFIIFYLKRKKTINEIKLALTKRQRSNRSNKLKLELVIKKSLVPRWIVCTNLGGQAMKMVVFILDFDQLILLHSMLLFTRSHPNTHTQNTFIAYEKSFVHIIILISFTTIQFHIFTTHILTHSLVASNYLFQFRTSLQLQFVFFHISSTANSFFCYLSLPFINATHTHSVHPICTKRI